MVFYAQDEALKFGEGYVSTEHLLLGLVRESDSVAARVLEKMGVSLNRIRAEVEKQLPRGDARQSSDMTLTPRAKRVIDLAYDEARNLNNNYIGTEHLLLGLIREGDGLAGRVLAKLGVELQPARDIVVSLQDADAGLAADDARARRVSVYPTPLTNNSQILEGLFLILTADEDGVPAQMYKKLAPNGGLAFDAQDRWLITDPEVQLESQDSVLNRVLANSQDIAKTDGRGVPTPTDLFLALLREQGEFVEYLAVNGVTYDAAVAYLQEDVA